MTSLSATTLEKILKLNPVNFTWKNNPQLGTKTGFIAQEVQSVFPEFVNELPNGYLGLDYAGLVVPAIKAIQEQQLVIASDSAAISEIASALSGLRNDVRGGIASALPRNDDKNSPRNDAFNNLAMEQLSNRVSFLENLLASKGETFRG